MKIFEWANDIEKLYHQIIMKTEQENSVEIQNFKDFQENEMKELLKKNHDLVNLSLESLSEDVSTGIRVYEDKIDDALKKIENYYQKKKNKLVDEIIEDIGFNFK